LSTSQAGRATPSTDESGLSALATDQHFREIGHGLQAVAGGISQLGLIMFHTN
jgi:hypothetical protein